MPSFDSNGRLRVTFAGSSGSSASSGVSILQNDTLIATGITHINFADESDNNFVVTLSGSSGVTVKNMHTAIMALTGFQDSGKTGGADFYYAADYAFATGSTTQNFMVGALFKRKYSAAHAGVVTKYQLAANQGWYLSSPGNDFINPSVEAGRATGANVATRQLSFPSGDDSWILAIGVWDNTSPQIDLWINGQNAASTLFALNATSSAVPLIVGAFGTAGTSGSARGESTILISGVSIRTGAFVSSAEAHWQYYIECKHAGDLVQSSLMGWDHLWSVKQNTPGATWSPAVGSVSLIRTGSLTVVTDSNPRWA